MEEELLGTPFDGSRNLEGLSVDFKTGELKNLIFDGFDAEGDLVFIQSTDQQRLVEENQDWLDKEYLENIADLLLHFSEIQTQNEVEDLAKRFGPLFGPHYCYDGVCVEPIEMWYTAASFFSSAFYIRTLLDSRKWEHLLDSIFEAEFILSDEQQKMINAEKGFFLEEKQELIASLKLFFPNMHKDYRELTLNTASEIETGLWTEMRWDGPDGQEKKWWQTRPIAELSRFDKTPKDFAETLYDNKPQVATSIHLSPRHHPYRAGEIPVTFRTGLGSIEIGEELAEKLCRNMLETLISIHTRQVRYSWMGHQFRPLFAERIRYMWFIFAIYLSQGTLDYCAHCGRPFWRTRTDKKYCGATCRTAANK